jgi:hypothetical protein
MGGNNNDFGKSMVWVPGSNTELFMGGESLSDGMSNVTHMSYNVFRMMEDSTIKWACFLGGLNSDEIIKQIVTTGDATKSVVYALGYGIPNVQLASTDLVVFSLDGATGALIWHKFMGGDSNEYPAGLQINYEGKLLIGGVSNSRNWSPF